MRAVRVLGLVVLFSLVLGVAGQACAAGGSSASAAGNAAAVYAASSTPVLPEEPSAPAGAGEGQQRLMAIAQRVLNLLLALGALVGAIMVAISGYHIVTSVDGRQKADAMQGLYKTLLGVGIVFGSVIITKVVVGLILGG